MGRKERGEDTRGRWHLRTAWFLIWIVATGAFAQTGDRSADDEFITSLDGAEPVDTRRLAKLFFGAASTLEGGKPTVRRLAQAISVREAARDSVVRTVAGRFSDYQSALDDLLAAVSPLLDAPDSSLHLFRVLTAGHHACWRLDAYTRVAETYGATSRALMTILSSTEACNRFRRVATHPRVLALVDRSLGGAPQGEQSQACREELRELELLLQDLQRIDEDD